MKNDIEVVFFDLFHTLITPQYNCEKNEFDIINMTQSEWELCAEDPELYGIRASSKEMSPYEIIKSIITKYEINAGKDDIEEILKLREERFRCSLCNIDKSIMVVLEHLKNIGKRLCLISNADIIDVMYWKDSPLIRLFDEAVFSFEVGYLKPQKEIYETAIKRMDTSPENCIFIGDGGSNELWGARELGIKTILAAHLLKRDRHKDSQIFKHADYYIEDFYEIKKLIK